MFSEDFAGRILPFDSAAVPAFVDIVRARRRPGPAQCAYGRRDAAADHRITLTTPSRG